MPAPSTRTPSEADLRAGHRRRLRERVLADPASAQDYEILELLLGYVYVRRDNKMLAKRLLVRFGNLAGFLAASPQELREVEGCGVSVDTLVALIREIIARSTADHVQKKQTVTLEDVAEMGRKRLSACRDEEVWVALLDKQNRLITFRRIRHGSFDHVELEPLEVTELMIRYRASSLVLLHNHPGGSYRPSLADRETTERIAAALKSLGLCLQDHVIITANHCFSLRLDRSILLP